MHHQKLLFSLCSSPKASKAKILQEKSNFMILMFSITFLDIYRRESATTKSWVCGVSGGGKKRAKNSELNGKRQNITFILYIHPTFFYFFSPLELDTLNLVAFSRLPVFNVVSSSQARSCVVELTIVVKAFLKQLHFWLSSNEILH